MCRLQQTPPYTSSCPRPHYLFRIDHLNELEAKPHCDKRSGQDQTAASARSPSAISPGPNNMSTNVNDELFLYRQPTQRSDMTALASTPPPPHSHATESGASISTTTVNLLETATQRTIRTPMQTAGQGSSHSAVQVPPYPPHTQSGLEVGIPEWCSPETALGLLAKSQKIVIPSRASSVGSLLC